MASDTLIADSPRQSWLAARGAWLPWSIAGLCFILYAASAALHLLARSAQGTVTWDIFDGSAVLVVFLPFLAFPVVGALIASRRPGHAIGWICLAAGILWMVAIMSGFYAQLGLVAIPGSVPFPAVIGSLGLWLWVPALGLLGIYLILLFPDGRLPSRGWRPLPWLSAAVILVVSVSVILEPGPMPDLGGAPNPFGIEGRPALTGALGGVVVLLPLCILASAVSLILRFRRSRGEVRQQIKWIACAASVVATGYLITLFSTLVFAPDSAGAQPLWTGILQNAVLLSYAGIPVAIGFALLRYRLYDLDFIINRALVYGALTASVVAIYVLVVGYLGALFRTGGNLAISLVATGLVAVIFQPLRDRLQRGVNRLTYGERDDPYAVVSRFGQRLEETLTPEAVLKTITETVRETLKLSYVAIALKKGDEAPEVAASAGKPVDEPLRLPLAYQNEPVGELLIGSRGRGKGGEDFSAADRRLLEDLARQAGIAAHAVRLTADVQRSREQLVTAREEERRRLRRDLHDGLGAQLAGLNVQTSVLRRLIPRDPAAADDLAVELKSELQSAIADVRRLVYDLRPPALDDLGLVTALRQLIERYGAQGTGLRVTVEAPESDSLPPLPAAVEVAIYRVVQEAPTNVVRHARAQSCVVRLFVDDEMRLEVADDGSGVPEDHEVGVRLLSMRERAAELGGDCTVQPGPEGGTRVLVRLPLTAKE